MPQLLSPGEACVQLLKRLHGDRYEKLSKFRKQRILNALGFAISLMDDPPLPGKSRFNVDEAWQQSCDRYHGVLPPGFDFEEVTGHGLNQLIRDQYEAIALQIAQSV